MKTWETMMKKICLTCIAFLLAVAPVWAGNGHLLHGVGAINSSMGGVAVGLPVDEIGALHVNPALLTQFEGDWIGFSVEAFEDDPGIVASRFGDSAARDSFSGTTEIGVLPAIGFSHRGKDKPFALGIGLLAVAGFRVDWAVGAPGTIFAPQPFGFSNVKTDLAITKIPLAVAYQVNENLSIGGSLAIYQGSLAISPLPPQEPDCTTLTLDGSGNQVPTDDISKLCFYRNGINKVTTWAYALQLGLYYKFGDWGLGVSYTTPQDFNDYVWDSSVALPYLDNQFTIPNPSFGERAEARYPLDGPAIFSIGLGYTPNPKFKLGFDFRWVGYSDTDGAGGAGGFRTDRGLNEIGWDDMLVGAVGLEYMKSQKLTLRAGFNYSETPIQEEVVFTSLGTPPTFQAHYTVGLGYQLTDKIQLNLGAYYAPKNTVTGPLLNAAAPPGNQALPGSTFSLSEELKSVQFALSYTIPNS